MGKVSVGTGSCFCQWLSEHGAWLQQTSELPPGAVRATLCGVTSTSSLFSGFLFGYFYPSFAARRVCHVVLWKELSWKRGGGCADTLGSHDLLPFLETYCLLTAQNRKKVQPGWGQSPLPGFCLPIWTVHLLTSGTSGFSMEYCLMTNHKMWSNKFPVYKNFGLSHQGYLDQMGRF